jgi:hypothetical protein
MQCPKVGQEAFMPRQDRPDVQLAGPPQLQAETAEAQARVLAIRWFNSRSSTV